MSRPDPSLARFLGMVSAAAFWGGFSGGAVFFIQGALDVPLAWSSRLSATILMGLGLGLGIASLGGMFFGLFLGWVPIALTATLLSVVDRRVTLPWSAWPVAGAAAGYAVARFVLPEGGVSDLHPPQDWHLLWMVGGAVAMAFVRARMGGLREEPGAAA